MRVGFALGNIGPIGTMDNLIKIAERAEALAYGSRGRSTAAVAG